MLPNGAIQKNNPVSKWASVQAKKDRRLAMIKQGRASGGILGEGGKNVDSTYNTY